MISRSDVDFRKCCDCEYAKWSENFTDKDGSVHPIFRCGKHKQIITEFTIVGSTCKGVDYKRRGE